MKKIKIIVTSAFAVAMALAVSLTSVPVANAADLQKFDPAYIISDENMYTSGAMSKAEIKSFLQEKNAGCVSGRKTGSKKEGNSVQKCIYEYTDTISKSSATSKDGIVYCKDVPKQKDITAADMIYQAQQACSISAKVLLVMLQKEQSLITDPDPRYWQYRAALGYGCPDTAKCDADYYGLWNQLYMAGYQLQRYRIKPTEYSHFAQIGDVGTIKNHPKGIKECGGQDVAIKNAATRSLYLYTPYVPNDAAKAEKGDKCSSYGNLNFYRYYNDWFGNPRSTSSAAASIPVYDIYNKFNGNQHFYTSVKSEKNAVVKTKVWKYSGIAFYTPKADEKNVKPVYGFANKQTGAFFFTLSKSAIKEFSKSKKWDSRGIAFYAYRDSGRPVYRVYNSKTKDNYYTTSKSTANKIAKQKSWKVKGISFYAKK